MSMTSAQWMTRVIKPTVFVLCLIPALLLLWDTLTHHLGANPVEKLNHRTGIWTLRLLLITLCVTPFRKLTGWNSTIRLRRMLGLFTFFYACLHFSTWLVFDHFFDVYEITKDIIKRPYITVGFSAFVMLIPLAVTSTNNWQRLLGKRWAKLHQLIYVIATFGVLHFLWLVKADVREPVIYGSFLTVLLLFRVWARRNNPPISRWLLRQQPGARG